MERKIKVEVSARHIHLTQENIEKLFGTGHQLTPKKELSQPGQFASEERVTIVGAKSELKATILGPARNYNQVELSLTDARTIGVEAMVRESGHIEGTKGIKVIGPCGEIELTEGVIAAKRHIHLDPKTAEEYQLKNGDIVSVEVKTDGRSVVFGDTVIRVSDKFTPFMHVDTDEGNAALLSGVIEGTIL